jgi:hypothetical protein
VDLFEKLLLVAYPCNGNQATKSTLLDTNGATDRSVRRFRGVSAQARVLQKAPIHANTIGIMQRQARLDKTRDVSLDEWYIVSLTFRF